MRYKNDWPEARERLSALWQGRILDRPCLAVTAPVEARVPWPAPALTPEQLWTDPQRIVACARAALANTWWGGESVPSVLVMCGWLVCFGGTPRFDWNTIWHDPMTFDFDRPPHLTFAPDAPWVRRHTACYLAVAEAAGYDDFLLGAPCLLPANDLLSMLMGTEAFLLALHDHPEWMRAAICQGAAVQAEALRYYRQQLNDRHAFPYGIGGWMPFWAPEPFISTQSDVSCMLSPAMYDTFVLPELESYAEDAGALWYHLDGGDARQHLPRLLSLPRLRVLQYTPAPCEPPNGPAHLAFYRQVQAAGKIVHIDVPRANVVPLLRELDPRFLLIKTQAESPADGEALLRTAAGCLRAGA